jgi:hypothetical protein
MSRRDAVAAVLFEWFPVPGRPVFPWEALDAQEQEYWRVVADLALAHRGADEEMANLIIWADAIEITIGLARQLSARLVALRTYARHLDGCAETPCSCGLAALLP